MKYVPSIAFDEMSGSAKGVTAAKSRGRKYIRNRGYGGGEQLCRDLRRKRRGVYGTRVYEGCHQGLS